MRVLIKGIKNHLYPFKSVEVAVKRYLLIAQTVTPSLALTPDCLSLRVFVSSNMLSPGQKTYCSTAKRFTVNWMLSAHCDKDLMWPTVTPIPPKNSQKYSEDIVSKSWSCSFLWLCVGEGVLHPEGQRVDQCKSCTTHDVPCFFFFSFFSLLSFSL